MTWWPARASPTSLPGSGRWRVAAVAYHRPMVGSATKPLPEGWIPLDRCGCCGATDTKPAGTAQDVAYARCVMCSTIRFAGIVDPAHVYRDGYHSGDVDFGFDYADADLVAYEEDLNNTRLQWIEQHVAPGRLLDVGGGIGHLSGMAARRGWQATLLEPVAAAAAAAQERYPDISTEVAGTEGFDRLDGPFDAVCFVHSIEHIPPARETLEQARDLLGEAGHLYVEVPNFGSLSRRLQGDRWLGWQAGEHVYLFEADTLVALVERAGYEIVAATSFVPGSARLTASGYAHFLGLQPALEKAVRVRWALAERLNRSSAGESGTNGDADADSPPPDVERIDQLVGWRQKVFGAGFERLAALEERTGRGTNLQILARPRR